MTHPEITALLQDIGADREDAFERLIPMIQEQLHRMAQAQMRKERTGHTLEPAALVNEAFIRLAGAEARFENRAHFFGAAAEAMRRILIDYARRHRAERRGGDLERVTFYDLNVASEEPATDLLALDQALDALEAKDPRLAQVVRLRYFVGFTIHEVAEILETSPATVKRDWTYARAWLFERMRSE